MKNFSFAKWLESDAQRPDSAAELQKVAQRLQRGISQSQEQNVGIEKVVAGVINVLDKARSIVWDVFLKYDPNGNSRASKIWYRAVDLVGQMEKVLQQHGSSGGAMMSNPAHQYQPDDKTFAQLSAASGDSLKHAHMLGNWKRDHGDQPQQIKGTDDRVSKWIYSLAEEIERQISQLVDMAR